MYKTQSRSSCFPVYKAGGLSTFGTRPITSRAVDWTESYFTFLSLSVQRLIDKQASWLPKLYLIPSLARAARIQAFNIELFRFSKWICCVFFHELLVTPIKSPRGITDVTQHAHLFRMTSHRSMSQLTMLQSYQIE